MEEVNFGMFPRRFFSVADPDFVSLIGQARQNHLTYYKQKNLTVFDRKVFLFCGADETRTRDLLRDRQAF